MPTPEIGDRQHGIGVVHREADRDLAAGRRVARRVVDQDQQRLPQPFGIPADADRPLGQRAVDMEAIGGAERPGVLGHVPDQLVGVDHGHLGVPRDGFRAGEGEQVLDQPVDLGGGLDDPLERGPGVAAAASAGA